MPSICLLSEPLDIKWSFTPFPCENSSRNNIGQKCRTLSLAFQGKKTLPSSCASIGKLLGAAGLCSSFVTDEKGASEASTQFFWENSRSGIRSLSAKLYASFLCKRFLFASLRPSFFFLYHICRILAWYLTSGFFGDPI